MRTKAAVIDWAGIESDFRTGAMSIRELAKWHQVSEAAVRKRAKAGGWVRADAAPTKPVKKAEIAVTYRVTPTGVRSDTTQPEVIVGRGRNLALRMLDELDAVTSAQDELGGLIVEATAGDETERRREAMMKALTLSSRANTLKALASALKTLAETHAPLGKKAAAQEASSSAGEGTSWGDDLTSPTVN
jgi:hypothetical protein